MDKVSAIRTTFGPSGRSKLVISSTGSAIVTKEGQVCLEAIVSSSSKTHDSSNAHINLVSMHPVTFDPLLQSIVLKTCLEVGKRHGDGSLTTALLTCALLQETRVYMNDSVMIHGNMGGRGNFIDNTLRIRLLKSLESIKTIFLSNQTQITENFVRMSLWYNISTPYPLSTSIQTPSSARNREVSPCNCDCTSTHRMIRGLWASILLPAMNATIGKSLENLLFKWSGIQSHLSCNLCGASSNIPSTRHRKRSEGEDKDKWQSLVGSFRYALDHLHILILRSSASMPSTFSSMIINDEGNMKSNHNFRVDDFDSKKNILEYSSPLDTSICLPINHLILEGAKCRNLPPQINSYLQATGASVCPPTPAFRFVCIKEMSMSKVQASEQVPISLKVSSLHEITSTQLQPPMSTLRSMLPHLQKYSVNVIICGDAVKDTMLFEAVAAGLTVIEQCPLQIMNHLSHLTGCSIFDDANHLITSLSNPPSTLESIKNVPICFGKVSEIRRIKLTKNDTVIKLGGLESCVDRTASSCSDIIDDECGKCDSNDRMGGGSKLYEYHTFTQLILTCSSASVFNIYVRLLRRCMVATISLLEESFSSSANLMGALTPGAGANELIWSVMWDLIADKLQSIYADKLNGIPISPSLSSSSSSSSSSLSSSSSSSHSQTRCSATNLKQENVENKTQFIALVDNISQQLYDHLQRMHDTTIVLDAATLCRQLANAYASIPICLSQNCESAQLGVTCGTHMLREGKQSDKTLWTNLNVRESGVLYTACKNMSVHIPSIIEPIGLIMDSGVTDEIEGGGGREGIGVEGGEGSDFRNGYCDGNTRCSVERQDAISLLLTKRDTFSYKHCFHHELPVVSTSRLFWSQFVTTLDNCQFLLRIGGSDGVIRVSGNKVKKMHENMREEESLSS